MNSARIAYWLRLVWAPLLMGLEFTNLLTFLTEGGNRQLSDPRSPYVLQFATYGICALIVALDPSNLTRLIEKRIFKWACAILILFAWGMLVRTFYSPAGIPVYDFFRMFGLQIHAIGFMIACVILFDDRLVLTTAKLCVALATLIGAMLNLYEFFHPGLFSSVSGRAAGLYADSNASGMALVFGCLIGLTLIPRRLKEIFALLALAGVVATFSREAMLGVALVFGGAMLGKAVSLARLLVVSVAVSALLLAFGLPSSVQESGSWNTTNLARLSFDTSDASAQDRAGLSAEILAEFEAAPLFGHGFGTDMYWSSVTASHDFFLNMLADYGILGVFVIPALILSVRRKSWDFYTFGLIFGLWTFFSHLVLLLPFSLIVIALEAVESSHSSKLSSLLGAKVDSPLQFRLSS